MSSYFDDLNTELHELFKREPAWRGDAGERVDSPKFIAEYKLMEERVVKTVSLACGDREFPEDLREQVMSIVAVARVFMPETNEVNQKNLDYLLEVRLSKLFDLLHAQFHVVASCRVNTRFGMLGDDPAGIVKRRDAYDAERVSLR